MENDKINVLQIDGVKEWRGGQQQVFYLLEGMRKNSFPAILACQPGSALETRCRTAGIEVFSLPMRNELDFIAGWRIASFCKKRKINILHAHSAHALSIALWARMFNRAVKIIAARRVAISVRKSLFSIKKYDNRFVDRIICISEMIRKVMLKDGVPPVNLRQIYSGIDLNKFAKSAIDPALRSTFAIPDRACIAGTIAAFTGLKDYPTLLHAAKIAVEKNPEIHFIAVGSGRDEAKMQQLAQALAIDSHFHFAGKQSDVGPFLKAFDFFVAASRKEGLGTSVLDALAVGLPVVGTNAGGIPESVKEGINGLLVPKQNPQAMAAAILQLAADADLRRKFAANAPASVEKFAIENTVAQTIGLYKKLLEIEPGTS